MKKLQLILLLPLIVFSPSLYAKTDVVTSISVWFMNSDVEFEESLNVTGIDPGGDGDRQYREASAHMSGADIGVTIIEDRWFYGLLTSLSGQEQADYELDHYDAATTTLVDDLVNRRETTNRSNYSALVGYNISDKLGAYFGMTAGNSRFGDRISTEDSGPFIGAKYVQRFSFSSSMTYNLAISLLRSQVELSGDTLLNNTTVNGTNSYEFKSDTVGISFSATWLKSLDRGRSYFLRAKISQMTYEGSGDAVYLDATPVTHIATAEGEQQIITLSIGMAF